MKMRNANLYLYEIIFRFSDFRNFSKFFSKFPFPIFLEVESYFLSLWKKARTFLKIAQEGFRQIPLSRKLNFSSVNELTVHSRHHSINAAEHVREIFFPPRSSKLIFQIVHFTFFFGRGIHNQTPAVVERKGGTNRRSEGWISVDRRWSYSQTYNTLS